MGVSGRVWSVMLGKKLRSQGRTKVSLGLHSSHYIIRDNTEPRGRMGWELSEVRKGDSKDNRLEECGHEGKKRSSIATGYGWKAERTEFLI